MVWFALCFLSQTWVKSGQNRPKFKNSENWEKKQFFHVSITFVALELVAPAQIEKKWIFLVLHVYWPFNEENTNELPIMLKNGKI